MAAQIDAAGLRLRMCGVHSFLSPAYTGLFETCPQPSSKKRYIERSLLLLLRAHPPRETVAGVFFRLTYFPFDKIAAVFYGLPSNTASRVYKPEPGSYWSSVHALCSLHLNVVEMFHWSQNFTEASLSFIALLGLTFTKISNDA